MSRLVFAPFIRSNNYSGEKYSIYNMQPKGYNFQELLFFAPYTEYGKDIRSKELLSLANGFNENKYLAMNALYLNRIREAYASRWDEIMHFVKSFKINDQAVFCCWCPHTKATRNQINDSNDFICHCGLVGKIFEKYRKDIDIYYDRDYQKLVDRWRPDTYRLIDGSENV